MTGSTASEDFPTTTNAYQRQLRGGGQSSWDGDGWVAKIDNHGSLGFATLYGGTTLGNEGFFGPVVDPTGNVYCTGRLHSEDCPLTKNAFQRRKAGTPVTQDAVLVVFRGDGQQLLCGTYFGGSEADHGRHIGIHPNGIFVCIIGKNSQNSAGIKLYSKGVKNVIVEDNYIHDNTAGVFDKDFGVDNTFRRPEGSSAVVEVEEVGKEDRGECKLIWERKHNDEHNRSTTYGPNFLEGKPYTISASPTGQWGVDDPDVAKLTDGIVGPPYAGGTAPSTGAIWDTKNGEVEITVDMGQPNTIGAFRIHLTAGWPWWDALQGEVKDEIEVSTSLDGQNYSSHGPFELNL